MITPVLICKFSKNQMILLKTSHRGKMFHRITNKNLLKYLHVILNFSILGE